MNVKTKIIGVLCLLFALVSFIDAIDPGGLSIQLIHVRPFLFPLFCVMLGWIELHGREKKFDVKDSFTHLSAIYTIVVIIILVIAVLLKNNL